MKALPLILTFSHQGRRDWWNQVKNWADRVLIERDEQTVEVNRYGVTVYHR